MVGGLMGILASARLIAARRLDENLFRLGVRDETPIGPEDATTLVLGPTLMPGWLMPRFYAPVVARLHDLPAREPSGDRGPAPDLAVGPADGVCYYPMPEVGGLGRTDRIVERLRPRFEQARRSGVRLRLVGHSLGGIIAWALCHEYPDVVEVAELWAAPIRGTVLATTGVRVPESRFLAPESRWLRRYRDPVQGPLVRAVYSPLDPLATPSLRACVVEGDTAENHVVSPLPLPARFHCPNQYVHLGLAGHTLLPRRGHVNRDLAFHDARSRRPWAVTSSPARARRVPS